MAQKHPTFLHRLRSKGPKPRRRTDGFYHTTRWRKLRRYALSREPLCRDPFGEHAEWSEVVSATEVDHIVPRRVRPELELALENLQALCKRCHSRKTKAESRGSWGTVLTCEFVASGRAHDSVPTRTGSTLVVAREWKEDSRR